MKNYNNFGTQDLNAKEIEETNGGFAFLIAVAAGLTTLGIYNAIEHPEAFFDGLLKKENKY